MRISDEHGRQSLLAAPDREVAGRADLLRIALSRAPRLLLAGLLLASHGIGRVARAEVPDDLAADLLATDCAPVTSAPVVVVTVAASKKAKQEVSPLPRL